MANSGEKRRKRQFGIRMAGKRLLSILTFLIGFTGIALAAEEADTVALNSEFGTVIRIVLIIAFAILMILVMIAVMVAAKDPKMVSPFFARATSDGRDKRSTWREFSMITVTGIMILGGIFILSFNPVEEVGETASAEPAEDWTEIPVAQLVMLDNSADLAAGKDVFTQKCALCHGNAGEGGAGPNLTDKYWLHGGGAPDLYNVITNGVPKTSMTPWGEMLTPKSRLQVASFILSLQGSDPANGKAPEGEIWEAPAEDAAPAAEEEANDDMAANPEDVPIVEVNQ